MTVWTVYFSPRDFPGKYVVRRFDIFRGNAQPLPSSEHYVADTLEAIRQRVPQGLVCLTRYEEDDPNIVEVWL